MDTARRSQGAAVTAVTVTLGLAAAAWVVAVRPANGMDMGVATELGSFAFFLAGWIAMMAAMMLPTVAPAIVRHVRSSGPLWTVPRFVGGYLAVWALVGVGVFLLYQPHGPIAAGVVVIAAGVYELTPLKHRFRQRCRESVHSGVTYGGYCVASCSGLMAMLVALGVMSLTWMAVTGVLVLAQRLLPRKAALDVPLAVAIVGLGILVIVAPASVPGLLHHPM